MIDFFLDLYYIDISNNYYYQLRTINIWEKGEY